MRAPSTAFKIAALLVLLPAGWIVLYLIAGVFDRGHGEAGIGRFYGLVHARLLYFGPEHSFLVRVEASSPERWHWVRPSNYQYRILDFEWSGETGEGKGQIDSSLMMLKIQDRTLPITRLTLSELLFGSFPNLLPKDIEAVAFLERFIADAGQGRLPPPRHHTYSFKKTPFEGSGMTHFSIGFRFPRSLYWWTGTWVGLCLWLGIRSRWRECGPGTQEMQRP